MIELTSKYSTVNLIIFVMLKGKSTDLHFINLKTFRYIGREISRRSQVNTYKVTHFP